MRCRKRARPRRCAAEDRQPTRSDAPPRKLSRCGELHCNGVWQLRGQQTSRADGAATTPALVSSFCRRATLCVARKAQTPAAFPAYPRASAGWNLRRAAGPPAPQPRDRAAFARAWRQHRTGASALRVNNRWQCRADSLRWWPPCDPSFSLALPSARAKAIPARRAAADANTADSCHPAASGAPAPAERPHPTPIPWPDEWA